MNRSKKEPMGKRFDKAVNKAGKKIGKGKDKVVGVKEDIADAAHDIGKSVKKTAAIPAKPFRVCFVRRCNGDNCINMAFE